MRRAPFGLKRSSNEKLTENGLGAPRLGDENGEFADLAVICLSGISVNNSPLIYEPGGLDLIGYGDTETGWTLHLL